ncbi:hypothetical protein OAJ27_01585 [bacterium]|nr:hypothetical protein [bacterium]
MKKTIITSLVMAALAATSLTAGIEYGPSITHNLGSSSAGYGVTVQNEMVSGTVYFANSKLEGAGKSSANAKNNETSSSTVGVNVNYASDALSDNVTFLAGVGYWMANGETKTAGTTEKDENTTINLNVGTRHDIAGFQVDITSPLVSMKTKKKDANSSRTEDEKTTSILSGVNVSLTKLF